MEPDHADYAIESFDYWLPISSYDRVMILTTFSDDAFGEQECSSEYGRVAYDLHPPALS